MNYDNRRDIFTADNSIKGSTAVICPDTEEKGDNVKRGYSTDAERSELKVEVSTHASTSVNDQDTTRQSAVNAAEAVMLLAAAVSASYSDESSQSILNPQSLLSTEEVRLNHHHHDNDDAHRANNGTGSPIFKKEQAMLAGRLLSDPPSSKFRSVDDNLSSPSRAHERSTSTHQGGHHEGPTEKRKVERRSFTASSGDGGEGEIVALPWTRRFYEESRNEKWRNNNNNNSATNDETMTTKASLKHPLSSTTTTYDNSSADATSSSSSYQHSAALFPMQLQCALSHPSKKCKLALEWLPHGKSWRILRWEALDEILPLFFPECGRSIDIFLDMVEAWGFKRITDVSSRYADQGSYFHEYFQLDAPGLCQRMKLHHAASTTHTDINPFKRCRLLDDCDKSSSIITRETTMMDRPSASTRTRLWNDDVHEEEYTHVERRAHPSSLPVSSSGVISGYDVSTTKSSRGGRLAAGYRSKSTHGTTPDRVLHHMRNTNNSYRFNLSNNLSFGSSFEDNETYNNYYTDLPSRRLNLLAGKRESFSFDSNSTTEKLSVSEELQEIQRRGCKVFFSENVDHRGQPIHEISRKLTPAEVDHSSSSKSSEVLRNELLRGTNQLVTKRNIPNDDDLRAGSFLKGSTSEIYSYDSTFKTPDRISSTKKRENSIVDDRLPQSDHLRNKHGVAHDVNPMPKPIVVTPSSCVRPMSLCSGRGGKSQSSASSTPPLSSNEAKSGTKSTMFNVSRRGSFAKRISTKQNQEADDRAKVMLSFN